MAYKMEKGNILRGLILRNEKSNENYDTDFLYRFVKYSVMPSDWNSFCGDIVLDVVNMASRG